jgi:hypothetical protein
MTPEDWQERLSRIQTLWTRLLAPVAEADKSLVLRYYGAALRYLQALVQDGAVAEELAQDFAVRFLNGHYSQVDPERGRFRAELVRLFPVSVKAWTDAHRARLVKSRQAALKSFAVVENQWDAVSIFFSCHGAAFSGLARFLQPYRVEASPDNRKGACAMKKVMIRQCPV